MDNSCFDNWIVRYNDGRLQYHCYESNSKFKAQFFIWKLKFKSKFVDKKQTVHLELIDNRMS